jgi:Hsp70 protein
MHAGVVRLGVDYGTAATVAVVCWPDGRWRPVVFDGGVVLPSAVFVADGGELVTGAAALLRGLSDPAGLVTEPRRVLTDGGITVAGRVVEPLDLVAATLRRVREAAAAVAGEPVGQVRLVVPASWGPRRRTVLRRAAHRAGLAQATLVEAPVAVAARLVGDGAAIPVGSWLGVCDLGAGFEASVLRRGPDGFEVLAAIPADAGGRRLDAAVAAYLAELCTGPAAPDGGTGEAMMSAEQRSMLATAAATARRSLAVESAVTVPLPGGRPPVVLTSAHVQALAGPVWEEAARATRQAVTAAEAPARECAGLYLVGGGAPLAPVASVLAERLQLSAWPVEEPKLAAVLGAVRAGEAAADDEPAAAAAGSGDEPAAVPRVRQAVGVLVPGVACLLLAAQFYATVEVSRVAGEARLTYVLANWGQLGLAAIFALLAALAAATVFASALSAADASTGSDPSSVDPAQQMGTGLLAAVATGMTVAALIAVVASVAFPVSNGPFLRWALLPPLPLAVTAAATAVLVIGHRLTPPQGWHAWLALPHASIVCAAAGMLLAQYGLTGPAFPATAAVRTAATLAGACLFGAGVAFALPLRRRYQIILAAPMAAFSAAIVSGPTTGVLAGMYVVAATLWWARLAWRLVRQRLRFRAVARR